MPIIKVGFERAGWTKKQDFTGGKTYSADSEYNAASAASKAFDDDTATLWNSTNTLYPHWIQVDLGSGVTKIARKLRFKLVSSAAGARLKNFKYQGSNNGSTWMDIYTGVAANNSDWQEFTFSNSTAYRYYRIYGTDSHDTSAPNYMVIYEIEMMEMV